MCVYVCVCFNIKSVSWAAYRSTLYSRQSAVFVHQSVCVCVCIRMCVCWCPKQQSILLKSTHSCLAMRQSSNVLVNKNHSHLSRLRPPLILFVLVFPFCCKTLILFPNAFQISSLMFLSTFLSSAFLFFSFPPRSDMKSVTRLFASVSSCCS